jgi:hypothetical protein
MAGLQIKTNSFNDRITTATVLRKEYLFLFSKERRKGHEMTGGQGEFNSFFFSGCTP